MWWRSPARIAGTPERSVSSPVSERSTATGDPSGPRARVRSRSPLPAVRMRSPGSDLAQGQADRQGEALERLRGHGAPRYADARRRGDAVPEGIGRRRRLDVADGLGLEGFADAVLQRAVELVEHPVGRRRAQRPHRARGRDVELGAGPHRRGVGERCAVGGSRREHLDPDGVDARLAGSDPGHPGAAGGSEARCEALVVLAPSQKGISVLAGGEHHRELDRGSGHDDRRPRLDAVQSRPISPHKEDERLFRHRRSVGRQHELSPGTPRAGEPAAPGRSTGRRRSGGGGSSCGRPSPRRRTRG